LPIGTSLVGISLVSQARTEQQRTHSCPLGCRRAWPRRGACRSPKGQAMSLLHPHLPPTRPTPPQARQPPALAGECRGRRAPTGPAALRVRACQPQPPQQPPQRRRGARRVSAPALDAPALVAPGANRCEARVCQASWPCVGASRGALLSSCTVQVTVVMKFGGSSVADAARMREVAAIVCGFTDELPCVVLSAMGKVRRRCAGPAAARPGSPAALPIRPRSRACHRVHPPVIRLTVTPARAPRRPPTCCCKRARRR